MNTKVRKVKALPKKSVFQPKSPMAISVMGSYKHSHIILYRDKNQYYTFTVFWINYENSKQNVPPREAVCRAMKAYKTKAACILAIKKLCDAFPLGYAGRGLPCYDDQCKEVDTEIKVEVKRHF